MVASQKSISCQLKICGITRSQDLATCCALQIRYVGFNFHGPSARYIAPMEAAALWRQRPLELPSQTEPVAVLVDWTYEEITTLLKTFTDLQILQLHGNETSAFVTTLRADFPRISIWKAIAIDSSTTKQDVDLLSRRFAAADLLLFDTKLPGSDYAGGAGRVFDWDLLQSDSWKNAFGIAGGLDAESIPKALTLRPTVLDICSGSEISPGIKDASKIEKCVVALQNYLDDPEPL